MPVSARVRDGGGVHASFHWVSSSDQDWDISYGTLICMCVLLSETKPVFVSSDHL